MRLKFRPRDRHAAGRSRICRGLVACAEVAYFRGREGERECRERGCVGKGRVPVRELVDGK